MNNEMEYIGKDDLTERELFLISLDTSFNIPKVTSITHVNTLLIILLEIQRMSLMKKY